MKTPTVGLGQRLALATAATLGCALLPSLAAAERVRVTGELVDTWCSISGVMYAYGTAHHQCAVWCAVGGIPVSVRADDGTTYMVLRIDGDAGSVANPKLVTIQGHRVTVDGDLHARDGVNYLLVDKVATDEGIVNLTHDEHGIVPFGE
jgi:hypothetical protein